VTGHHRFAGGTQNYVSGCEGDTVTFYGDDNVMS